MSIEWFEVRNNVADLIDWMGSTDRIQTVRQAAYVARCPWQYGFEYRQMLWSRLAAAEILSRKWPDDGSREQAAEAVSELVGGLNDA